MTLIIDTHAHLLHPRYTEETPAITPQEAIRASQEAGVGHIINISITREEWAPSIALTKEFPNISTAIGIHPEYSGTVPPVTKAELLAQASHQGVVALGETGLDYYFTTEHKQAQWNDFHTHLSAAEEAGLPVVVHSREAEADTLSILKEHPQVPFLIHCFTGTQAFAEESVERGGYISFSGILTFKKAQNLRDIAAQLPANRLLVETDAPYLAPEPFRGKRAIPGHVVETLKVLAATRQQSVEEMAQQTTLNAQTLFTRLPLGA